MTDPLIGSDAIATGLVTRGALRWNYRAILPDVYLPVGARLDVEARAKATWLWTGRRGVVAGKAAAALHGVSCVEDTVAIEVIAKPRRPQPGVVIRNERLGVDEIHDYGGLPITTPARTALDLARHLPRDEAVTHLDMLAAAADISRSDVAPLEQRYRGARGTASGYDALALMDGGTRSPEETKVRLWLIDSGLPRPHTSIGVGKYPLDFQVGLGWPTARIGVQWAPHRYSLHTDILFRDLLRRLDWHLIEVAPTHSKANVVGRCRDALRGRRHL